MRGVLLALACVMAACGGAESRGLSIEVRGLSARAETLVVGLFPDASQSCTGVSLASVATIKAPLERRWERSSGAPRTLEFDETIEAEKVTLVAYSLTAEAQPLQYLCHVVEYDSIRGLVAVRLSDRPLDSQ
ncbi:MAG: hypothetical protein HY791_20085 [Deltaproteobacteria bacterium]|nr:hypothetical protein [Deltaproteobacteria bacterium]